MADEEEQEKPHPFYRAWAAGVYDARMSIPKSGYTLSFETTNAALVERFKEVVGLGVVNQREKSRSVNPIMIYRTINMESTRELILLLAPFLSPRSIHLSSEVLGRIERNPTWKKLNPTKATSSITVPVEIK